MSLWHTIKGRSMLHDFPCTPDGCDGGRNAISYFCTSEDTPDCEIEDMCPLRPIYEEYMAMRAVVDAVLEALESTPANEAMLSRDSAHMYVNRPAVSAKYEKSAKAWEALT